MTEKKIERKRTQSKAKKADSAKVKQEKQATPNTDESAQDNILGSMSKFSERLSGAFSEYVGKSKKYVDQSVTSLQSATKEKTGTVKRHLAIIEIERSLNRLYAQIGKRTCGMVGEGKKMLLKNDQLKEQIELAIEYEGQLKELRKKD